MKVIIPQSVVAPAPGADWSVTVGADFRWHVLAVSAQLATSAAAANRDPSIVFKDPSGNVYVRLPVYAVQTASQTLQYTWARNGPTIQSQSGFAQAVAMTSVPLLGGWSISTVTTNIAAADQWSNIFMVIEQYDDLARPYAGEFHEEIEALARAYGT